MAYFMEMLVVSLELLPAVGVMMGIAAAQLKSWVD